MKIISKKINEVFHIILDNENGLRVELSCYGASIYNIELLNNGKMESMVLTPSEINDFRTPTSYHGKTIGRFSGRIDKGICKINDVEYKLDINWNNVSSLHGGENGLSTKVFEYEIKEFVDYTDVIFTTVENDEMLPGEASYKITYRIIHKENTITVFFNAKCTKDTIMNLTNHTYFNLSGDCKRTILNHNLYLPCNRYTRLNNELITISIDEVNEIMDFRDNHKIGKYVEDLSLQNHTSKGYDHCFIKEDKNNDLSAILSDEESGISLKIFSSYPCVVFYSGCYPDDFPFNKERIKNLKYHALCLEAQFIPNGINMESEDKAILPSGEEYNHYIKYSFIIK